LQEIEASLDDVLMRIQDAKFVSQLLSERASEMQTLFHTRPPNVENLLPNTFPYPQCKRSIIHVLACADRNSDRPAVTEQAISFYDRFHASLNVEHGKSKANFHVL